MCSLSSEKLDRANVVWLVFLFELTDGSLAKFDEQVRRRDLS